MNVRAIIDQAIIDSGITIPDSYGKRWINEAKNLLANLYDTACVKNNQSIIVADCNNYYDLPSDCIRIVQVDDSDKEKYKNFIADSTQIKFDDEDTYKLTYLMIPTDVTTTTETPQTHMLYHIPITYFLVHKNLENTKPEKSSDFYNKFTSHAKMADMRLNRMKKKGSIIPAPPYR
jgi:hypothetical protein